MGLIANQMLMETIIKLKNKMTERKEEKQLHSEKQEKKDEGKEKR